MYVKKDKKDNTKKRIIMNQFKLTENYVESIVNSLPRENKEPKEINVVFSSGGFNAPIGIGIGMFLKQMEKHKHIKVKRLSGSSIGAFLSLWYIMGNVDNSFDFIENEFINTIHHFKKNKNLNTYNSFVRKYVYKIFKTDDDLLPIQKRLFITYYDTKKYKKQVVCKYKNREHLINCIIQSGYIPYITDGNKKYKNRFMDGVMPHFFTKNKKRDTLYVNMMCRSQVLGCISINENNIYKRILTGVNDANDFFTTGTSVICIYTKDITYKQEIERNIIELVFFIILFIMDIIATIHFNTNMLFSDSIIYNVCYDFFYSFFEGFIDGFLFG